MYMAHQLNMINYKNANLRNKKWTNLRICQNGEKLWNLFYFQHNFIYLILYCISLNARMKRYKLSICKKLKKLGISRMAWKFVWQQRTCGHNECPTRTHTHTQANQTKSTCDFCGSRNKHTLYLFLPKKMFLSTRKIRSKVC